MKRYTTFLILSVATSLGFAQREVPHTAEVELEFSVAVPAARWINGFLPRYSRALNGATPAVWMLDRDGREVIPKTAISFPDAPMVEIHAVTSSVSSVLYASGEAWTPAGAGTGMILKVAPGDSSIQVIRTDDFLAVELAVTHNDEIWAFGLPITLQASRNSTSDYMTLYRFNSAGRLVQKLLPRSLFGDEVIPTHAFGNIGWPRLVAAGDRIGVYSAVAGRWIELDAASGKISADLRLDRPKASDGTSQSVSELVMTETTNEVYAFWGSTNDPLGGIYRLDKSNSKWQPANRAGYPEGCSGLAGIDGDDLILRSNAKAVRAGSTAKSRVFAWTPALNFH